MVALRCLWWFPVMIGLIACSKGGGGSSDPGPAPWSGVKLLGSPTKNTIGISAAGDNAGNSYVSGYTDGALPGLLLNGNIDAFVAKYDSTGARQWIAQLGVGMSDTYSYGFDVSPQGEAVMVGAASRALAGQVMTGLKDLFVAKYKSDGSLLWLHQEGVAAASSTATGVGIAADGSVYVAGYTSGSLNGSPITGNSDLFLSKYNASGVRQWTRLTGTAGAMTITKRLVLDSAGNIFVVGSNSGTGLNGNTQVGSNDFIVVKFDATGARQWTRQMGGSGVATYASDVAVDAAGSVYVVGETNGNLDFTTKTGTTDLFLVKYSGAGVKQWTRLAGATSAKTVGNGLRLDASGSIFVSGYTEGGLDGNVLAGVRDLFLMKFDASSVKQWTRQLGVAGAYTTPFGLGFGGSHVFVTGSTGGALDGIALTGINDAMIVKYSLDGVKK